MSNRNLDMVLALLRRSRQKLVTKDSVASVGVVWLVLSTAYWWSISTALSHDRFVALVLSAPLVLMPPAVGKMLGLWSRYGLPPSKNKRAWELVVVTAGSLSLLYCSYQMQYAWWKMQPQVVKQDLLVPQILVGIVGFVVIPALLWMTVAARERSERVQQVQAIKRPRQQVKTRLFRYRIRRSRRYPTARSRSSQLTAIDATKEPLATIAQVSIAVGLGIVASLALAAWILSQVQQLLVVGMVITPIGLLLLVGRVVRERAMADWAHTEGHMRVYRLLRVFVIGFLWPIWIVKR